MYLALQQVVTNALGQATGINAALLANGNAAEFFAEEKYASLTNYSVKTPRWVSLLLQLLSMPLTFLRAYLCARE